VLKQRKIRGWIHILEACERYGHDYNHLRRMVKEGIFTRGRFTSEAKGAPIYLLVKELDAFKRGGAGAVRKVQASDTVAATGTEG
jgi:hypothetical protein